MVEFPTTSPTSPTGGPLPKSYAPSIPEESNKPSRPEPSPSRLHSPPTSVSTPVTPPRSEAPKERPKTLNLRTSHSPRTPESGLGSTIPSSATVESLKNIGNEPSKKVPVKNTKVRPNKKSYVDFQETIPRRNDYIMLTDCSNTIPASHFKAQTSTSNPKPVPLDDPSKQHKKYQVEQHPKTQQRIHHVDLPRNVAPPLPTKSPKPVKIAPEGTAGKIPPIPMTLKGKNTKK